VDVYETVDFDGDRVTVLRQLVAGDPGFEKSGKRGDGKGNKTPTATIVLRGSSADDLDGLESAIDDGMNLITSLLEDRRLVRGAGAIELELARRVNVYGDKMKGQQQRVVKRFATALEVIPRTLAENAVVGEKEGNKVVNGGEDEVAEASDSAIASKPPSDGVILADSNSLPYPILDSLVVKHFAIKHAIEAAVSVLNMDDNIRPTGQGQRAISFLNFSFKSKSKSKEFQFLRTILLSTLSITIGVIVGPSVFDWF
jgi:T-complex protein 1 subunit theta